MFTISLDGFMSNSVPSISLSFRGNQYLIYVTSYCITVVERFHCWNITQLSRRYRPASSAIHNTSATQIILPKAVNRLRAFRTPQLHPSSIPESTHRYPCTPPHQSNRRCPIILLYHQ